jgi:hypothetical protein
VSETFKSSAGFCKRLVAVPNLNWAFVKRH